MTTAHLYDQDGRRIGSARVDDRALQLGARMTVALVREHPERDDRPLFCSGLLETTAPTHPR